MQNAMQVARDMVNSRAYVESAGPNRSAVLDALCREFGAPIGSSWCALFISRAFKRALLSGATGEKLEYTASSQAMLRFFQRHGWTSDDPASLMEWGGALIIRTNPDKIHGHVALVHSRFVDNGRLVALGTYEGNTDKAGGSNGDAAYSRRRALPLTPYRWTFCNTTALAGGSWWK